jgi:hypothetical protein
MAFGEPLDWTLQRQQNASQYFSTLEDFSPDENMDIDMSMFEQGNVPSTFSQSAMNLAGYAAQSRMPQQQQTQEPGFFSKLFSFLGEVDKPISTRLGFKAEGEGIASSLENIAIEEATRPSNIVLSLGGLLTGGLSTGSAGARVAATAAARMAARNVGMGIGARIAGNVAEQGLEAAGVENPYIRSAVGLGAGFLGGSLAGGATSWARIAKMGIQQGDEAVTAAARAEIAAQEAAQTARQQSRYGYLVGGLGYRLREMFGQGAEVGIGMPAENVYAGLPPMGARPPTTRTFPQGYAQAAAAGGVPPTTRTFPQGYAQAAAAGGAGAGGIGGGISAVGGGGGMGDILGSVGARGASLSRLGAIDTEAAAQRIANAQTASGVLLNPYERQMAANRLAAAQAEAARKAALPPGPLSFSNMTRKEKIMALLGVPMHVRSSIDASAPFRQLQPYLAGRAASGDAKRIAEVFNKEFSGIFGEQNFLKHYDDIVNSQNAEYYANMGIKFSDLSGSREELLSSGIIDKFPVFGKFFRASDRGYAAAVNEARRGLADVFIEKISKLDPSILEDPKQMERFGKFVMAATGRGSIPQWMSDSTILGQPIFWAPRLFASRLQIPLTALFTPFSKTGNIVRGEAIKELVGMVGTNSAMMYGLKNLGAADVETDPRSSDFGQIRVGDRRYDTWGGYRPIANLVSRIGVNAYNGATGSDVPNYKGLSGTTGEGELYNKSTYAIIGDFLKSKMSPVAGAVATQISGTDFTGRRIEEDRLKTLAFSLFAPLSLEQIAQESFAQLPEIIQKEGAAAAFKRAGQITAANLIYMNGVGGGYYLPRPADLAAMGKYAQMRPEDKLEAIRSMSWLAIRDSIGASDFKTYRAWSENMTKQYAEMYEDAGFDPAYSVQLAQNLVNRMAATKNYQNISRMYENQWIVENPEVAKKIVAKEYKKPFNERRLSLTQEQMALLQSF